MRRAGGIPLALALFALAASVLPGCARMRERWAARFGEAPEPARIIEPEAAPVGAAEQGLEVVVWTSDDTYFRVGRALERHATGRAVLPPGEADAWRSAGLRIVAIPVERLDELIADTPPIAPVQRQRYGQMPVWSPIVRGPRLPEGVAGPDGRRLEPGRPRLIVRSWIEPDLSSGRAIEVVRTELAIQIESDRRAGLLTDLPANRSIAQAGEILDALLTAVSSDGREAFVIVAETPGVVWADLPEPPAPASGPAADAGVTGPAPEPIEEGAASAPGGTEPGPSGQAVPGAVGPSGPRTRTLGEWMLASPGTPVRDGRNAVGPRKVLMVLVPRLTAPAPSSTPAEAADDGSAA